MLCTQQYDAYVCMHIKRYNWRQLSTNFCSFLNIPFDLNIAVCHYSIWRGFCLLQGNIHNCLIFPFCSQMFRCFLSFFSGCCCCFAYYKAIPTRNEFPVGNFRTNRQLLPLNIFIYFENRIRNVAGYFDELKMGKLFASLVPDLHLNGCVVLPEPKIFSNSNDTNHHRIEW